MSAPGRARQVLAEEGPRALFWRALAATCYRRVAVFTMEVEASPAREPPPGFSAVRMSSENAADYLRLRPDADREEFERRLGTGQLGVLIRENGAPVSARWYSPGRAEIPYLGFAYDLDPGAAYVHDVFTASAARKMGIAAWARSEGTAMATALGVSRFVAAVVPENRAGVGLTLSAGYRRIGTLACARLPGGRRDLRRLSEPHCGPAAPIDVKWSIAPPP